MLQEDYNRILDYFFQNKKYDTPNRKFFETLEKYRCGGMCSSPWTISWQITSACNLRCKHCFFEGSAANYDTRNDLNKNELLSLADELVDANVVAISISGGEAMLSDCLFELLRKLKSKNIAISLQTNATLITQQVAKELSAILNSPADYIQVSLDGSNKTIYEKVRGQNTFEKAINGIKYLVSEKLNVNVNTTILALNKDDLPSIFELASNLGVKKCSMSKFVPCNPEHKYLEVDFSEIIEPLFQTIVLSEKMNTFLELNMRFYDFVSNKNLHVWADEYLKIKKIKKNVADNILCHKHNTLYINSKGEVYLCFATECEEGLLGKYPQSSIKDIWENRKNIIFFSPKMSKKSECRSCKYFPYCLGGCMGNAFKTYGSIYAPDGLCKYHLLK